LCPLGKLDLISSFYGFCLLPAFDTIKLKKKKKKIEIPLNFVIILIKDVKEEYN
jgi:hypothetical protein